MANKSSKKYTLVKFGPFVIIFQLLVWGGVLSIKVIVVRNGIGD